MTKQAGRQRGNRARYILVVEDDKLLALQLASVLRKAGYRTRTAPDSQSALDVIDEAPPAVVVVDIFLPGANGWQLLAELRSHTDTLNLPVIVCSNNARAVELTGASLTDYWGVADMIDKADLTPVKLIRAVQKAVGRPS